jgi:hypothetical protein
MIPLRKTKYPYDHFTVLLVHEKGTAAQVVRVSSPDAVYQV